MAGEPEVNPTVARRELAVYFRRLREQRGRTPAQLGELLGVAQSQVSRLDSGARGFRPEDVERLCKWYGLGEGERGRLLALAEDARRRAWWQQVDLDPSYRTLIGLEQAAESINEFCLSVIPGLLQTERYAEAAATAAAAGADPARVKRAVSVRMRRQEILRRPVPPVLSVVIDEAALARGAGGDEVMREQFQHLLDLSDRSRTIIQVIGFESGMYTAAGTQFILLDMGVRIPPIYYVEDQFEGADFNEEVKVRQGRMVWDRLQAVALDPTQSAARIKELRDRLD